MDSKWQTFEVKAAPKPKRGKRHAYEPEWRGEGWPCGNDLCEACTALHHEAQGRRCTFTAEGKRCFMALPHRVGGPDKDHGLLQSEPADGAP